LESSFSQQGPLLITHWGFSGPAALKLSAWAARFLYDKNYQVKLCIDWAPDLSKEQVMTTLMHARKSFPSQTLITYNPFDLPKKLWKRLVELCQVDEKKRLSELSNDALNRLLHQLKMSSYQVDGKTTNKEEFVTCGGVNLDEVNFKTMESRLCKGVFFAGEVLDIDAVTGGFNFQNAWTTAWIAGQSIADE
jgi:predicted Rossmann fold flavoprotein